MRHKKITLGALTLFCSGVIAGTYLMTDGFPSFVGSAQAAGGVVKTPTSEAPDRYVYYPGTEALKPDEIRVIAAGTGMPSGDGADSS